jgi:hypothetical protein
LVFGEVEFRVPHPCGFRKGGAFCSVKLNSERVISMKQETSISHDDAMIRRIRRDPTFAVEYLKAAFEDTDDPRVLLVALRHVARACTAASQ